jgi:hypothetical protein
MNKIFKNWTVHNLFAHPISELVYWIVRPFGKSKSEKISRLIHDSTLPKGFENE